MQRTKVAVAASGIITIVTYEFEAEVDGQRRTFQREGKLRGWHLVLCVDVLHDPADPSDSRMALESGDARELFLSLASFLVLGVASFLLSRGAKPSTEPDDARERPIAAESDG